MHGAAVIASFTDRHRFLSNFYPTPITYRSIKFRSSEHAYQWAKCRSDVDRQRVLNARTPADAKRVGHHVALRPDWDKRRIAFMRNILAVKFAAGTELAVWLLDTSDAVLIEGEGQNWLGQLLMERRNQLRNSKL